MTATKVFVVVHEHSDDNDIYVCATREKAFAVGLTIIDMKIKHSWDDEDRSSLDITSSEAVVESFNRIEKLNSKSELIRIEEKTLIQP